MCTYTCTCLCCVCVYAGGGWGGGGLHISICMRLPRFILSFAWLRLLLFGQDRGVNNNTPAVFQHLRADGTPSLSLPVLWPPPQPDHCGCWSQTGWPRSPCACPCVSWHPPHAGASGCLGGCWPRPRGSPAPPSVPSPPERSRAAEDASPCTCPQWEKNRGLVKQNKAKLYLT